MIDILTLQNRIDFLGIIVAERCNPNGDPAQANWPRQDYEGHGIMSDVCLKRKIRDRLNEAGHSIFVVPQEQLSLGIKSLHARVKNMPELARAMKNKDEAEFLKMACEKWIDVRTFGQVFGFKGENVTTQVRGPMSIGEAKSLEPVDVYIVDITKCVNQSDPDNGKSRSSDTFGKKYKIDHGAYIFRGSIYPQLAKKTGFTDADADAVKDAILHMFQNDASNARPSGSMSLDKLYWWRHNCFHGQYSPANVFQSVHFSPCDNYPYYTAKLEELPGLKPEIICGW